MSGGREAGVRDVSAGAGAGIAGVGFAGVVAEPAVNVTTVDVDVDEATATVSAAFSVFTEQAVAANRNAMERRIEGIEVIVRLRLRGSSYGGRRC
jgi:hypothetical protein